jgi:hypothetical protein
VSATALTLFVVPILYTLLIRDKHHPHGLAPDHHHHHAHPTHDDPSNDPGV